MAKLALSLFWACGRLRLREFFENGTELGFHRFEISGNCDYTLYDESIGDWHDTGHAETPALLGLTPLVEWLQANGSRLIGLHLHDVIGMESHYAPGTGL